MAQKQSKSTYINELSKKNDLLKRHNETSRCNPLTIVINMKTSKLVVNNKEFQVLEGYPFINIVTSVYNQIILF